MRTIYRALGRGCATIGCLAALLSALACNNNQDSPRSFATGQFPPVLSDTDYHRNPWTRGDCLICHEHGRNEAPVVQHRGMAAELLTANCPSCHVLIPGRPARP
jgi:hypothetical protein